MNLTSRETLLENAVEVLANIGRFRESDALRKTIAAMRDVCSAQDARWADANVSLETAAETLAATLAEEV